MSGAIFPYDDSEIAAKIGEIFSSDRVQIKTAPAEELMVYLEENIIAGEKGKVVQGNFRDGKNSGIRYSLKKFPEFLGYHISWSEITANYDPDKKRQLFFSRILATLGHEDPASGTSKEIFQRLIAFLTLKCDESPARCFILWFDDVHTYEMIYFFWLFDISNEMDKHAKLFIILSMPKTLETLKQKLRAIKRGDIVQRFMLKPFTYRGLRTIDELKEVLQRFSEYSDGEFPTISQLFRMKMGKEYSLEALAEPLWAGFRKRWKKKYLLLKNFELGMKWPCSAAARILLKVHEREWESQPKPTEIEDAINDCGFSDALEDLVP